MNWRKRARRCSEKDKRESRKRGKVIKKIKKIYTYLFIHLSNLMTLTTVNQETNNKNLWCINVFFFPTLFIFLRMY